MHAGRDWGWANCEVVTCRGGALALGFRLGSGLVRVWVQGKVRRPTCRSWPTSQRLAPSSSAEEIA